MLQVDVKKLFIVKVRKIGLAFKPLLPLKERISFLLPTEIMHTKMCTALTSRHMAYIWGV
ncbi:hypothetical protein DAMNIGENAA_06160 [Desulforhabdus amnigena]|jgi:hypothetical protein|uniref:Uncharacterized protein n=1 Tax=Desulforhabdus amnigena TaxID=40218 RepID=A0A9W6FRM8_9BACT|nr:hypothetical protein DAMNIGENAA_06160 [Desulforhabdus amnigena]